MIPSTQLLQGFSEGALAAGAAPSRPGVILTPEEVTQAIFELGRGMAELRAFLGASTYVQPAPPPQQHHLPPPPPPSSTLGSSTGAPQFGMPPDSSVQRSSGGVPITQIQFPPSPSELPPWLSQSQPIYTSSPTQPWLPPPPLASLGPGHGGVPAPGVLYGGASGPLFHGTQLQSPLPYSAAAAGGYRGGPFYGGAPNHGGTYRGHGGPPPFGTSDGLGGQPPFGYDPQVKFYKLEFPTYDGTVDPLNWLNQCDQFFRGQRTPASNRTWLASYHLRGGAQTWYYALEQDEGMPPWERFRDLCRLRFGPPLHGSRLAELGRLPFATSVQEFADRFQALACHAPDVSTRQRAELFVGGLPEYIRVDVEMHHPQDLQAAIYYARAFERRAAATPPAPPARPTSAAAGPSSSTCARSRAGCRSPSSRCRRPRRARVPTPNIGRAARTSPPGALLQLR